MLMRVKNNYRYFLAVELFAVSNRIDRPPTRKQDKPPYSEVQEITFRTRAEINPVYYCRCKFHGGGYDLIMFSGRITATRGKCFKLLARSSMLGRGEDALVAIYAQ